MANKPYYELQGAHRVDDGTWAWLPTGLYGTKKECEQHKIDKIAKGVPASRLRIERIQ